MGTLKVNGNIEVNQIFGTSSNNGLIVQAKNSSTEGWCEGIHISPHSGTGFSTLVLGPIDKTSGCAIVYHKDTKTHYLEVKTADAGTYQSYIPYSTGTLLNSGNYTSYTVTKTGSGASGTWGISITGSAVNSDTVDGYHASSFLLKSGDTATGNLTAPTYIATQKMVISATGLVDLTAAGTTRLYADGIAISNPGTKNDDAWIRVTGTGESDTILEIATGDDGGGAASTGPEQIVVRQYGSNGLANEIKLLDTEGITRLNKVSGFHFIAPFTFQDSTGTYKGGMGCSSSDTYLWNQNSKRYLQLRQDGGLTYNGWVILHSNNYTSYAAPASHSHSYLPLSGGTMTGTITGNISSSSSRILVINNEADTNHHQVHFGYGGNDKMDFYEYGALWNFYKGYQGSTYLCGAININGWVQGSNGYGTSFPSSPAVGQVYYYTG